MSFSLLFGVAFTALASLSQLSLGLLSSLFQFPDRTVHICESKLGYTYFLIYLLGISLILAFFFKY